MKTFKQFTESLWANIHKKRQRIKKGSGEKMRKKGEKGAPTPAQMQRAKGEGFREDKEDEKLAKTIDVATKKAELAKRVNQMTKQGKATLSRMTDKDQKKQRGDQIKQQIKQVKDSGRREIQQIQKENAPDTSDAMKRYKSGKAGFTDIAHLKAKGLIKRSDGTKRKSDKYK